MGPWFQCSEQPGKSARLGSYPSSSRPWASCKHNACASRPAHRAEGPSRDTEEPVKATTRRRQPRQLVERRLLVQACRQLVEHRLLAIQRNVTLPEEGVVRQQFRRHRPNQALAHDLLGELLSRAVIADEEAGHATRRQWDVQFPPLICATAELNKGLICPMPPGAPGALEAQDKALTHLRSCDLKPVRRHHSMTRQELRHA